MKHIQNNQKSIGKPIPASDFKNIKKKSANQKFVISIKKTTVPYGMDLKIYRKYIA